VSVWSVSSAVELTVGVAGASRVESTTIEAGVAGWTVSEFASTTVTVRTQLELVPLGV
jgi:hypothetical protein